jgi:hypothetical protein
MRFVRLGLLCATLAACQGSPPTTAGDTNVAPSTSSARAELGQPFDLKVGESVAVGDAGLKITFSKVAADSRCPIDVVCVWAGDAEVALRAEASGRSGAVSVHTLLEPRVGSFGSYKIELVQLTPTRRASQQVPAKDYVARLVVNK